MTLVSFAVVKLLHGHIFKLLYIFLATLLYYSLCLSGLPSEVSQFVMYLGNCIKIFSIAVEKRQLKFLVKIPMNIAYVDCFIRINVIHALKEIRYILL